MDLPKMADLMYEGTGVVRLISKLIRNRYDTIGISPILE